MTDKIRWILFLFLLPAVSGVAVSQSLQTPVYTGFGGGGTAASSGYESMFVNPANLHLTDREYRMQIAAGVVGARLIPSVAPRQVNRSGQEWYLRHTEPFQPEFTIPADNGNELLDRNYPSRRLLSSHQSSGEIHWIGLHRPGTERSFAIALRSRFSNRYEVGRHFYDAQPVQKNGESEINRTLTHRFQSLHELAFGFAETFTFMNDRFPHAGRLVIGITPKLVASGSYLDAEYSEKALRTSAADDYQIESGAHYHSSGIFSTAWNPLQNRQGIAPSEQELTDQNSLFRIRGFGGGFDFGITYLYPFGEAPPSAGLTGSQHSRSLRISLSVTDIGFIAYGDDLFRVRNPVADSEGPIPNRLSTHIFAGRPGEFTYFLSENEIDPFEGSESPNEAPFAVFLPAAMHTGAQIRIDRITLVGDLSIGLTENAYHSTRVTTYLGGEIRLHSNLPIRAGTRLEHTLPALYSFGTGIETTRFDLNLALQIRKLSNEVTGISIAAMKFYIP